MSHSRQLDMFVVSSHSRGPTAQARYLLSPAYGVMALAMGNSFCSTGLSGVGGGLAEEVVHYLSLGLSDSVANMPDYAAYEKPPRATFSAERIVAGLRLVNGRLRQDRRMDTTKVGVSLLAFFAQRGQGVVIFAGLDGHLWRVRHGRLEWILQTEHISFPQETHTWIGRRDTIEPQRIDLEIEDGDVFGIGMLTPEEEQIFATSKTLDKALASCLAQRGLAPYPPLLVGRI